MIYLQDIAIFSNLNPQWKFIKNKFILSDRKEWILYEALWSNGKALVWNSHTFFAFCKVVGSNLI